ncbi:carbohydrate-binding protein [Flavobacterium sp.]|uniref:carbohydrate-binding protein n=1 Tax=Flavobacterium sp. TaxID=239 RepID=UPI004047630A
MKKKIYATLVVMIVFYNLGISQISLGSNEALLKNIKKNLEVNASKNKENQILLKVAKNKNLIGKINFQKSSISGEFLIGETKNNNGSFYINLTAKSLEGHIIIKATNKAYKYYSDSKGNAFVESVDINTLICVNYENVPDKNKTTETSNAITPALLNLQSLPGAAGCVLLDFDGYYMPAGNLWNNGNAINAAPSGMSDAEVQQHWEVVSEDYRPFNLNVTTNESVFNSYPRNRRMRVVVTPTNTAAPGAGGVAYIGSFNWDNDVPCWVFITSGKSGGDASSHEIGHTFDLGHDGRTNPNEGYFVGIEGTAWAPIMGAGYYRPVVQWSKGEYNYANNLQDDVAIIAGSKFGVGYRGDDYSNGISGATNLTYTSNGTINQKNGVISSEADYDFFTFTTGGGNVIINANTVSRDGNLHLLIRLFNASGTQIGTYWNSDPFALNATMNVNLAAGKYFIGVDGNGAGNAGYGGYSAYGSIGSYSVTGTISPTNAGVATVYKDCNYGGYAVNLVAGNYTLSQLQAKGIANDDISSLKVNNGYEIVLYNDDNFLGSSIIVVGNDSCLVDNGFNDITSSLRVRATASGSSILIQAEDYASMNGIQTEVTTDSGGGLNVGYADTGDWMSYNNINFPTSGSYLIEYRVASAVSSAVISSDLNGGTIILGNISIPFTGGWQNWQTVSQTVSVNAGTYNFGIYIQNTGVNLNWIRITKVSNAVAKELASEPKEELLIYPNPVENTLFFSSAVENREIIIVDSQTGAFLKVPKSDGKSIDVSSLKPGIYSIIMNNQGQMEERRFIKK